MEKPETSRLDHREVFQSYQDSVFGSDNNIDRIIDSIRLNAKINDKSRTKFYKQKSRKIRKILKLRFDLKLIPLFLYHAF